MTQAEDQDAGALLQTMLQSVDALITGARDARKALQALAEPQTLSSAALTHKHLTKLRQTNLDASETLCAQREDYLKALEPTLERHRRTARMTTLSALGRLARQRGLEMTRLGDAPPTFLLSPLTVEVDFEAGCARWLYARETVLETGLEPGQILDGRQGAMDLIKSQAVDSKDFFDMLMGAYKMVLALGGKADGERVDLVDLRVPLSTLGGADWRKMDKLQIFPRYLMAYQLHRLRRDGLLEHKGRRVDLGTATGKSTSNKRNVLFVPTSATEGQYYLSIRMEKRS